MSIQRDRYPVWRNSFAKEKVVMPNLARVETELEMIWGSLGTKNILITRDKSKDLFSQSHKKKLELIKNSTPEVVHSFSMFLEDIRGKCVEIYKGELYNSYTTKSDKFLRRQRYFSTHHFNEGIHQNDIQRILEQIILYKENKEIDLNQFREDNLRPLIRAILFYIDESKILKQAARFERRKNN